jgi:thymidylate kinase
MDGPRCEEAISVSKSNHWFLKVLINQEKYYYQQIQLPDLLIVLKVDPEIAVQRKVDETEISVRARSTEVWKLDWDKLSAFSVDASKSKSQTLSQVKEIVWEHL